MRASVGVTPPEGLRRRAELFRALSRVLPVDFEPRAEGAWDRLDAVVLVDGSGLTDVPSGLPVLHYERAEPDLRDDATLVSVELAPSSALDGRLRGRRLPEGPLALETHRLDDAGATLARDGIGPAWIAVSEEAQVALLAPAELERDEPLRNRLRPGRFLALLPLVDLLRRVTGYTESAPRAAFLVDDPNLHWPSYGYVDFGRLKEHALRHGYHVAFATVPLDTSVTHPGAVRVFRESRGAFSLALHGNDHAYQELASPLAAADAVALFDQAIGRVRRFERRTGLEVSRVMIPPHGLCADEMLGPMLAARIEALCRAPDWSGRWPEEYRRIARWLPADVSPSGAPILVRHLLSKPRWRDDVTLDLYLDQPAIVYGHHYDLAAGYDVLGEAAEWLDGFDGMQWRSLGDLARGNLRSVRDGDTLRVTAFTRRSLLDLAQDVRSVELAFPAGLATAEDVLLWNGVPTPIATTAESSVARVEVQPDVGQAELRLERRRPPGVSARRGVRPRALARRTTSEARDRLYPALRKAGLGTMLASVEGAYGRGARARQRQKREQEP